MTAKGVLFVVDLVGAGVEHGPDHFLLNTTLGMCFYSVLPFLLDFSFFLSVFEIIRHL